MILFDGTDKNSLEKSLAGYLQLEVDDFINLATEYFCLNASRFSEITLRGFSDYWKNNQLLIDFGTLKFDNVIFFHKTSVIDNGRFIRNYGLLPFNDIIFKTSPLNDYLGTKGIEFYILNEIPWINNNGNSNIVRKNNLTTDPREKAQNTIYVRLMNLEDVGIGGYLLLPLALRDHSYDHIKDVPEFLYFLDNWFPGISNDWKKRSIPYIVKCEVNIGLVDMIDDNSQQVNIHEASLRIAEDGFLCLAEFWASEFINSDIHLVTPWWYPFIRKNIIIPPEKILKFIDY